MTCPYERGDIVQDGEILGRIVSIPERQEGTWMAYVRFGRGAPLRVRITGMTVMPDSTPIPWKEPKRGRPLKDPATLPPEGFCACGQPATRRNRCRKCYDRAVRAGEIRPTPRRPMTDTEFYA